MARVTWPNLAINLFSDSPLSCRMVTSGTDIIWCGLLVANWATNFAFKVAKESIDPGGKRVNQLSTAPLREVGKTLQYMYLSVVNKVNWETYELMCLSGSVVPSYLSKVGLFQLGGNLVASISSVKGNWWFAKSSTCCYVASRSSRWETSAWHSCRGSFLSLPSCG